MKPNWKKGLSRLWLAFAVVWWIAGAITGVGEAMLAAYTEKEFPASNWVEIILCLLIWILPPLVIAGIWKMGAWTIQGFKSNWEKGIFRLCLSFSILWWVGGSGFAVGVGGHDAELLSATTGEVYLMLAIWILPPLLIAGIWKGGAWIIKGFKEEKPPIIEDKEDNKE